MNRVKELVERLQPRLVFLVADLWIQKLYLEVLADYAGRIKLVAYSPVDAGPVDRDWVEKFDCLSRLVTFTEYARAEVLKALPSHGVPRVGVIPLGVDTKVFFPFPGTEADGPPEGVWDTRPAKRALNLFADDAVEDSFLVLNAHRNQPRKRIDVTIKGFAAFARNKPSNVQLYLHMGIEDMGWNVLKLAKRYGVFDRLIVTQSRSPLPGIASEHLNLVYNACDVGLNTSTGEGWGLPNFEHAAAGKAQVVPRFGALAEIWAESAEFVEPVMDVVYEFVLSEGRIVSVEGVGAALEALYVDRGRLHQVAEACYRRAKRPENSWEEVGRRWHLLFQEVLEE